MKIKVKESLKTFCRWLLLWQFHLMHQILHWKKWRTTSHLNITSDSKAIYGLLLTASFQGWDPGPFRHCWWRILTYTWSQCWHLLCAFCYFYIIFFSSLVWCWGKQRAHHQHTQQRDPTTHSILHPLLQHSNHSSSSTASGSLAALKSKVSAHSCSHSSSSSFIPQPLPAAKSFPFPPQPDRSFGELRIFME